MFDEAPSAPHKLVRLVLRTKKQEKQMQVERTPNKLQGESGGKAKVNINFRRKRMKSGSTVAVVYRAKIGKSWEQTLLGHKENRSKETNSQGRDPRTLLLNEKKLDPRTHSQMKGRSQEPENLATEEKYREAWLGDHQKKGSSRKGKQRATLRASCREGEREQESSNSQQREPAQRGSSERLDLETV